MAETATASQNSVATSPVKKPWQTRRGTYRGGLVPVRIVDPYANDRSTTK